MSLLQRMKVVSQPIILKRRGRFSVANAVAARPHRASDARVVDAEVIHNGDEQAFWCEKRWFYQNPKSFMPTWDRSAQTLILLSRAVPRIPQEAAFRLFAVFMKMLMITKVTELTSAMLPLWSTLNLEGLLQQAKKDAEDDKGSGVVVADEQRAQGQGVDSASKPPVE